MWVLRVGERSRVSDFPFLCLFWGGVKSAFGINLQRRRKAKGLLAYSFISNPNLPSLLLIHLELKFGVGGIENVFFFFFFSFSFLCFGFLGSGKTSLSTRDESCGVT